MLEIKILAGAESKVFLADLEKLIKRMEAAVGGKTGVTTATSADEEETEVEEEEETDFAPKSKKTAAKKKAAAAFDEDEEEAEAEEEEEKPAKKTTGKKTAKVTLDDVNDACMAALDKLGGTKKARNKIVAILTEDFDCENGSVSELSPDQYGDVVTAMGKLKA